MPPEVGPGTCCTCSLEGGLGTPWSYLGQPLSCERKGFMSDRIEGGRIMKAGKQYFSVLFVQFFLL